MGGKREKTGAAPPSHVPASPLGASLRTYPMIHEYPAHLRSLL